MYTMNPYSYTLMTAMRGPDYKSCVAGLLKQIFVTRLRSEVFIPKECFGDDNQYPLLPNDFVELIAVFKEYPLRSLQEWKALEHFLEHLKSAINLHILYRERFKFLRSWTNNAVRELHRILSSPPEWDAQCYIYAFNAFSLDGKYVVYSG